MPSSAGGRWKRAGYPVPRQRPTRLGGGPMQKYQPDRWQLGSGLPNSLSRRQFVEGAGVAGLGLLAGCMLPSARTGQPAKIHRIGFLGPESANTGPGSNLDAFQQGMGELGYIEGQHYVLEARFAEGSVDRHTALAHELLAQQVDVFVAGGPGAIALRDAKATQPIVTFMADPVAQGLAASFARPGGNITGLSGDHRGVGKKSPGVPKGTGADSAP